MTIGATSIRKPSTPRSSQKRADIEHRRPHRRIPPVQVRLLRQKRVEVVLPGALVEVQAGPKNMLIQLFGGPPSGRGLAPRVPIAHRAREG